MRWLALLLLGCSAEPTCMSTNYSLGYPCPENFGVTFTVDERFTREEQDAIKAGIEAWQSERPIVFWNARVGRIEPTERAFIEARAPSETARGRALLRLGSILIRPDMGYERTRFVAMHELGHLAGLDHGPAGTVMGSEWPGAPIDLDETTLAAFDRLYP